MKYIHPIQSANHIRTERGIEVVSYKQFLDFQTVSTKAKKYLKNRWDYYKIVAEMITIHPEWKSVLELGAAFCPIVPEGDLMDKRLWSDMVVPTIIHDAIETPWPIPTKQYDLFIALQVWEHLEGYQQRVFAEVMRVAKNAILSFPYKWENANDIHRNITHDTIGKWTLNVQPTTIVETDTNPTRVIYYWNFEHI